MAQDSRKCAVITGMGMPGREKALDTKGRAVGRNVHPRFAQRRLHVFFTHHEQDAQHLAVLLKEQVEKGIRRILATQSPEIFERLPRERGVSLRLRSSDDDALPSA